MALTKYDYEKLLDDIKLISRTAYLLFLEKNPDKKRRVFQLFEDLITRLYRDIKEMHESAPSDGNGYGGYISDEIKEELLGDADSGEEK